MLRITFEDVQCVHGRYRTALRREWGTTAYVSWWLIIRSDRFAQSRGLASTVGAGSVPLLKVVPHPPEAKPASKPVHELNQEKPTPTPAVDSDPIHGHAFIEATRHRVAFLLSSLLANKKVSKTRHWL